MIRYATEETARRAVLHWGGDESTLTFLAKSGAAVWRFEDDHGRALVLRLIDPAHRTRDQIDSELAFVRHLAKHGARVAEPDPTLTGIFTLEIDGFVASAVTHVPGEERPATIATPAFDRAWGAALATLHAATRDYDGPKRWEWSEEPWLADADRLLPAEDRDVRALWTELQSKLAKLPRDGRRYGTIHGDHGPQNFRYDAATGEVTTFDFGNACRHWFAMDVTVALSTLRRDAKRSERSSELLAGYRAVAGGPPPLLADAWPDLLELRFLYVYLSRLDHFGPTPTEEQRLQLDAFRSLVIEGDAWPLPPEATA